MAAGQVASLTGLVTHKDFPGPPNYESIADGHRRETAMLLRDTITPRF